jgi:Plasmid pRiA4b ORF-3-like protein
MAPVPRTSTARRKDDPPLTYQLKVTLMETDPPIWRRLAVAGNTTLARLDRIIQATMGWTNSHLHTFTVGGVIYAEPSPEWEIEIKDERRVRLSAVAREEGEAFVYEYDLGDSWRHQVLVEEVLVEPGEGGGPRCLAGERACPPEDSGGVGGYYDMLVTLRDRDDEEYESTKVWVESMTGGPFDPEAFDVGAANEAIEALAFRRR